MSILSFSFQFLESNYRQSMVVITEENVNVFNFDNVKVKLTKMESERAEGKRVRTMMSSFTPRSEEMLSLDDRIENRNLFFIKDKSNQ